MSEAELTAPEPASTQTAFWWRSPRTLVILVMLLERGRGEKTHEETRARMMVRVGKCMVEEVRWWY